MPGNQQSFDRRNLSAAAFDRVCCLGEFGSYLVFHPKASLAKDWRWARCADEGR